MSSMGQILKARRAELGLTLQQVADAVLCARSYLSTIENDRRERPPSQEILGRLEVALRMRPGELTSRGDWASTPSTVRERLLGLETDRHLAARLATLVQRAAGGPENRSLDDLYRSGELKRLVDRLAEPNEKGEVPSATRRSGASSIAPMADLPMQVPVINKVTAGYPAEFTDLGYPARIADEYISVPGVTDADAFAARVVGDSMAPDYREGDIVVFSPLAETPAGSDCFARFDRDDETTFKRIYFEESAEGGQLIRFQPLNPSYPPKTLPREAVAGLYRAVYVIRPLPGCGVGGG